MITSADLQIVSACCGAVGSVYFARGVLTQSNQMMASLSKTYWDANPFMPKALAEQKAHYVVGVVLLFAAFVTQLVAIIAPVSSAWAGSWALSRLLISAIGSGVIYLALLPIARILTGHFEKKIRALLQPTS